MSNATEYNPMPNFLRFAVIAIIAMTGLILLNSYFFSKVESGGKTEAVDKATNKVEATSDKVVEGSTKSMSESVTVSGADEKKVAASSGSGSLGETKTAIDSTVPVAPVSPAAPKTPAAPETPAAPASPVAPDSPTSPEAPVAAALVKNSGTMEDSEAASGSNESGGISAAKSSSDVAVVTVHEVKMLNNGKSGMMVFEPSVVKAKLGDTVKFIPTDVGHNTASFLVPDGGVTWKSGVGEELTVTLDKEGVYLYQCEPHSVMAMVGIIQVGKATNMEAAQAASKEISATFALNKDRLDKYMQKIMEE